MSQYVHITNQQLFQKKLFMNLCHKPTLGAVVAILFQLSQSRAAT